MQKMGRGTWPGLITCFNRCGSSPPCLQRRLVRHSVQPVPHRLFRSDRCCFAGENEEGRLESVFGVVLVQQTAARAPDHRTVSVDEGCEGRLVVPLDESAQQFAVVTPCTVRQQRRSANVVNQALGPTGPHVRPSPGITARLYLNSCRTPSI
jgi:hypothetical protein